MLVSFPNYPVPQTCVPEDGWVASGSYNLDDLNYVIDANRGSREDYGLRKEFYNFRPAGV